MRSDITGFLDTSLTERKRVVPLPTSIYESCASLCQLLSCIVDNEMLDFLLLLGETATQQRQSMLASGFVAWLIMVSPALQ
jgi:hypothetical protein